MGGPTTELWRLQSVVLLQLSRASEAVDCARRAVEMAPASAAAWGTLGSASFLADDYEQALAALRKAAEVGEPTAGNWRMQSLALRDLNRYPEALTAAERAHELAPDDHNTILAVVRSLMRLGRHDDALARLEAAPQTANQPTLLEQKAWCLVRVNRPGDGLAAVAEAEAAGANPRGVHHARGDILLLSGRYAEALTSLEAGLAAEPDDWDLTVDREVALACLGRHGERMEALPVALAAVAIPAHAVPATCDYILEVSSGALQRNETDVGVCLFRSVLAMESWHDLDWYGAQVGAFLRQVLDLAPEQFPEAVDMVTSTVANESVLRLVDPFIQAAEYARTGDVTILERLFPEIREIVMEIGERLGRPRPGGSTRDD